MSAKHLHATTNDKGHPARAANRARGETIEAAVRKASA